MTAGDVVRALEAAASESQREKIRARVTDPAVPVIGVRMGELFAIAKEHDDLPLAEIDALLDFDAYEARLAAVSIMDFQARRRLSEDARRDLHDLWLRRIDRIDTWDLIDRSAPRVMGLWLMDKPRDELFALARSPMWWHRRAAITSMFLIIRSGDIDDALALCELLAADPERFVQTNVGVALREVGRVDRTRLEDFLARRGGDLLAEARRTARVAL